MCNKTVETHSLGTLDSLMNQLACALTHGVNLPLSPAQHQSQDPPEIPLEEDAEKVSIDRADPAPFGMDENPDPFQVIARTIQDCQLCGLCLTRNHTVPGMGALDPLVLVVGEGPGSDEDRQGLPFVGKAGQYLDEWLNAIGLNRRETVYITNLVKCRPPQNRDPHPEEITSCTPFLEQQIQLLKPRAILSVGRISSGFFMGGIHRMEDIHGKIFEYRGIPVVPTYHPAAVLRNQDLRKPVWNDLKNLHNLLLNQGLVGPLPDRKSR